MNTIREALAVLASKGWTKDAFTDSDGHHCLQGALYEAHGVRPVDSSCFRSRVSGGLESDIALVNRTIAEQYPERYGAVGISRFNDHPDTTIDDVVRVLEKAAAARDEQV